MQLRTAHALLDFVELFFANVNKGILFWHRDYCINKALNAIQLSAAK